MSLQNKKMILIAGGKPSALALALLQREKIMTQNIVNIQPEPPATEVVTANEPDNPKASVHVRFSIEREFPEGQWLSDYQLKQIERGYKTFLSALPALAQTLDINKVHAALPVLDEKSHKFIKNKWVRLWVTLQSNEEVRQMSVADFIDNVFNIFARFENIKGRPSL